MEDRGIDVTIKLENAKLSDLEVQIAELCHIAMRSESSEVARGNAISLERLRSDAARSRILEAMKRARRDSPKFFAQF